jgi:hypothetical protein
MDQQNLTQGNLALNPQPAQPAIQPTQTQTANLTLVPKSIENPTINYPVLSNFQDLMEAIKTNYAEGEKQRIDRISVPSGGGLSFTVIDENGQEVPVANIKGTILHHQYYCIRWMKKFQDLQEGEVNPFCFSADQVAGSGCPEMGIPAGQPCASCQFKQSGSDRNGGEGSDCHDRCAVFTLKEGSAMPVNVDLPRTSLSNWKAYRGMLTKTIGKAYTHVVTKFGLEKVEKPGKKYSAVTFARESTLVLTRQEIEMIQELKKLLMPQMVVDYTVMKQVAATVKSDEEGSGTGTGSPDINNMNFGPGDPNKQVY